MLKSISSNLTSIFLSHGLLMIFNSFNIEKKFYHEKLLPTSIVGSLPKPVWLAPPENFGLLGIRRKTYLRENKTLYAFHCMNNYWQGRYH
jgi:hypothetical protein